jgi:rsbT co-antagonist protein RsbR
MAKEGTFAQGLTADDLAVIRAIGRHLNGIIEGRPVEPLEVDRRDELGLLASMAGRAARIIARSREREAKHRAELERRVRELEEAYATQTRLLDTIRELSSPILRIHPKVLLLPLIGALDAERADRITLTLLSRIAAHRSTLVILDITGMTMMDADVALRLLTSARAAEMLGTRVILCGISPAVARMSVERGVDLSSLQSERDLEAAMRVALAFVRGSAPRRRRAR